MGREGASGRGRERERESDAHAPRSPCYLQLHLLSPLLTTHYLLLTTYLTTRSSSRRSSSSAILLRAMQEGSAVQMLEGVRPEMPEIPVLATWRYGGASLGRGRSGRGSRSPHRSLRSGAGSGERGGWSSNPLATENWLAARRGGAAGAADPIADPMAERPWARLPAALARLGAALARLRPPALNWLAGRLPPPVVAPAPPPPPAFCRGCVLPGALSVV